MIKTLQREIHLFDTNIAGTTYLKDKSVMENIAAGDRLILQREDNKFDEKAILILNEKKQKFGYVSEQDNIVYSRLMDVGKILTVKVLNKEQKGTFYADQDQYFSGGFLVGAGHYEMVPVTLTKSEEKLLMGCF